MVELVKLVHQLEKDYEQQLWYEGRMVSKHPSMPQKQSVERAPVQCLRCKGQHPPGKCSHYALPQSPQSSGSQYSTSGKHSYHPKSSVQSSNNSVAATRMLKSQSASKKIKINSSSTSSNEHVAVPQQLVVPIRIDAWSGKAWKLLMYPLMGIDCYSKSWKAALGCVLSILDVLRSIPPIKYP